MVLRVQNNKVAYEKGNSMKYILLTILFCMSLTVCAFEYIGKSHYEMDCFDKGWNCHKLSKEERIEALGHARDKLQLYLEYFKGREKENLNSGLNRKLYWQMVEVCKDLYLIDFEAKDCDKVHCLYLESVWTEEDKKEKESYNTECQ